MALSHLSALRRYHRGRRNNEYSAELISLFLFLVWDQYCDTGATVGLTSSDWWLSELILSARWTLTLIEDLHQPEHALSVWNRTMKPAPYYEVLSVVQRLPDAGNEWLRSAQVERSELLMVKYVNMLLGNHSQEQRLAVLHRIFN